jgi:23S rRNA (guanosine2251-2'-O)-methyltransferase
LLREVEKGATYPESLSISPFRNTMTKLPSHKFRKNIHSKKPGYRSQAKTEQVIWGIHPVLEALRTCPQSIRKIVVDKSSGSRVEEVLKQAHKHSIPVSLEQEKAKAGSAKNFGSAEQEGSQGVYARIILPTLSLENLLDKLEKVVGPPLLLALDSIQDPHNLGAIIRSAVAAGVNGIILTKDRSAPITGTVIKISAGSAFHIDICRVTNLVSSLQLLKEHGIWIFGTTKDASQPIYDADLSVPACLVIGSEGKGLRPLVAQQCDLKISIPMQGSLDSLNASVAAGIILFETVRQRKVENK